MCNARTLFKTLWLTMFLSILCSANSAINHVVSVQHSSFKLSVPLRMQQIQGSGICINQSCSVVVTAYHIQMCAGKANLQIDDAHTTKVLSLATDNDTNKADVPVSLSGQTKHLSYNLEHDISFIYANEPVHDKSGVPYSFKPYTGEHVNVVGYYKNRFTTRTARLIGVNVPLMWGQSRLDENLILDIAMQPGSSGSAVLDEQGNLLGMITLSGAIKSKNGDLTASVALPTRIIANALLKLDPVLGVTIFNQIPPKEELTPATPIAMTYMESDLPNDTSAVIPTLSATAVDASDPVSRLHARSEAASELMVNFLTRQCVVQGNEKSLCDELSVIDGQQTYRKIGRDGKPSKRTSSFPIQKYGVWTQSDWVDALGEIADNSWVFQGSVGDGYLFTFRATAEDDRCYYEEYSPGVPLFGGGRPGWKGSVVCFEQVLTDKDFNVLAVFTEMDPSNGCLTQSFQTAIYYQWIKIEGLGTPVLMPARERISAKVQGQKDLWYANVSWSDYREFKAKHKIMF
jgi:trypsin-like peptidase